MSKEEIFLVFTGVWVVKVTDIIRTKAEPVDNNVNHFYFSINEKSSRLVVVLLRANFSKKRFVLSVVLGYCSAQSLKFHYFRRNYKKWLESVCGKYDILTPFPEEDEGGLWLNPGPCAHTPKLPNGLERWVLPCPLKHVILGALLTF